VLGPDGTAYKPGMWGYHLGYNLDGGFYHFNYSNNPGDTRHQGLTGYGVYKVEPDGAISPVWNILGYEYDEDYYSQYTTIVDHPLDGGALSPRVAIIDDLLFGYWANDVDPTHYDGIAGINDHGTLTKFPTQTTYNSSAIGAVPAQPTNGIPNLFYIQTSEFTWIHKDGTEDDSPWIQELMVVWDSLQQQEFAINNTPTVNNRLEIIHGEKITRNGRTQNLTNLIDPSWTQVTARDLNNHGVILATAKKTLYAQGQAIPPAQQHPQPVLLVPAILAVDANHDGTITDRDVNQTTQATPYRFWSNDDDDDDDISTEGPTVIGNSDEPGRLSGFWELDGRTPDHEHAGVDGRSDLLDFFPVYLDIKQLMTVLPPGGFIQYKLKQADSALNFVYTNLTRSEASDYLHASKERVAYGLPGSETQAHVAITEQITSSGVTLSSFFLDRIKTETDKGVILIEGKAPTDKPLRLVVERSGVEVAEVSLNIKISEVEKMYRWINLRGVAGQSVTRPTDLSQPTGYPDNATNGKMFIWVHGYNVNERQSRSWNAEAFKRMYQSGSRAMFTAVTWHGDQSQIPYVGAAPDYWDNIPNAFQTAQALAPLVNGLSGSVKVIAGHSMGNIVVSAAIKDHGLNVTKYLMVDAAAALEAYDTSVAATGPWYVNAMRPLAWADYDRRLWSTDWWKLFPAGDNRRLLTWLNRFGNIPNAVNIYSSGEEVLNNNDETPGEPPYGPLGLPGSERIWVQQEMVKGTFDKGAILAWEIQGGWGRNSAYLLRTDPGTGDPVYNPWSPAEAQALTEEQLRAQPFFTRFNNTALLSSTAGSAAADYSTQTDLLGGAIPALSFAAGRNPVPIFGTARNRDLMEERDGWPTERLNDDEKGNRWFHSDIKNIAYPFNYKGWNLFVNEGNLR
jgi:hypothetical protein